MTSPGVIVAVDTTWSIRTICIARDTGAATTFGTERKESRHGPSSSGGCCNGIVAAAGGASGGGACATADVDVKEARRSITDRIMHAFFA